MASNVKLKLLRDDRNWSQEYVADRIGMSQPAYSKLESGQTKLTFERAVQFSKLYEVEPEYFYSDDSKFVHYGKENSYGPINNNTNYYTDESIVRELFEKVLAEKDIRIEEYRQQVSSLKQDLESANQQIADLLSKLAKKS